MKKNHKIIMAALLVNFGSASLVMSADQRAEPLTPRTSVFCELTGRVAREDCPHEWGAVNDGRRVLKATVNGNSFLGLFPADTKFSNALKFIQEVSDRSVQYPVTYGEIDDGRISRIVSDAPNGRFLIASYWLPLPAEEPLVAALPLQQVPQGVAPDHYDVLFDRLDGFLRKAEQDVQEQAKRLEGFGKKAEKDVKKVVQNLGRVFRKW